MTAENPFAAQIVKVQARIAIDQEYLNFLVSAGSQHMAEASSHMRGQPEPDVQSSLGVIATSPEGLVDHSSALPGTA